MPSRDENIRISLCSNHSKGTYGDSFNAHVLEQYKLYVQSAENVSARRVASNRYMLNTQRGDRGAYTGCCTPISTLSGRRW